MSHQTNELPDFLDTLPPATQLMIQRHLQFGDLEGADFLMKFEPVETRRKYELWKVRKGLLEVKNPNECRSGPGRLAMDQLEAEIIEWRKNIDKMLQKVSGKQNGSVPSPPKELFTNTLHINIPLTVLIPDEETNQIHTANAVLGLRSDYY